MCYTCTRFFVNFIKYEKYYYGFYITWSITLKRIANLFVYTSSEVAHSSRTTILHIIGVYQFIWYYMPINEEPKLESIEVWSILCKHNNFTDFSEHWKNIDRLNWFSAGYYRNETQNNVMATRTFFQTVLMPFSVRYVKAMVYSSLLQLFIFLASILNVW